MSCIFCNIINKEIPNYTVYEDADVLAFLDIHPHAKGHTLVIPKVHAETILDLTEDQTCALAVGVQRAIRRVAEVLDPQGFSVGWNHGDAGGQEVPHVHAHIFPRWVGDGGTNMHGIINNPGDMAVADVAALFE